MDKFNLEGRTKYDQLPLQAFELWRASIYVLDKNWNCLFVNTFAKQITRGEERDFIGKNIWVKFPALTADPGFSILKKNMEAGLPTNLTTSSPITGHRINIIGHALSDCYLFFSTIIPNKAELLNELRNEMSKNS